MFNLCLYLTKQEIPSSQSSQGSDNELSKFLDHIDDQAKINFQHIKIFVTGSAAAGKSCFRHLLLQKRFKQDYKSTKVQKTKHAYALISSTSLLEAKESGDIKWFTLSTQEQIDHCKSLLEDYYDKKMIYSQVSPPSSEEDVRDSSAAQLSLSSSSVPSSPSLSQVKEKIKQSKGLPKKLKIGDTVKLITIIDTGGQPGYIHLLPVLNCPTSGVVKCPTINFVVHDMTKSLDDPVLVRYKKEGQDEIKPYELPYTNKELIKQLMLIATDFLGSQNGSKSYVGFIGTHRDLLENYFKKTTDLNQQLTDIVKELRCDNITIPGPGDFGYLFPVNNKTSGTKDEGDIVKRIRQKIQKIMGSDSHPLPLVWMILELEVKEYCRLNKLTYISLAQYCDIAKTKAAISDEKSIKLSLQYFHQLGVFLNFAELPDCVIVDHQWFYHQLSKIVCSECLSPPENSKTLSIFQNQGIILGDELNVNKEGGLKLCDLVKLLCNMKVIAKFKKDDDEFCYIPCVLPYWQPREDKYRFLLYEPLLVRFSSGYLPRGFFCSLVVHLIQAPPEQWVLLHKESKQHCRNLINFLYKGEVCIRLHDKIRYLEVQIRHYKYYKKESMHLVFTSLYQSLDSVCKNWQYDSKKLQYGFICNNSQGDSDHMLVVPNIKNPESCTLDKVEKVFCEQCQLLTEIEKLHRMWFNNTGQCTINLYII